MRPRGREAGSSRRQVTARAASATSGEGARETAAEKKQKKKKLRKEKEAGKKKRKQKKAKLVVVSSSEETEDSSEDSLSETESEESSEEEDRRERKRKVQRREPMMCKEDWAAGVELWAVEDRPAHLQERSGPAGRMRLSELLAVMDRHLKNEEKRGTGDAVFAKDAKQKKIKYPKFVDDGEKRLHPARWSRLPVGGPAVYFSEVPVKRDQVQQNLELSHYGAQGQVEPKTIVKVLGISNVWVARLGILF
jgi:hypothetical protein